MSVAPDPRLSGICIASHPRATAHVRRAKGVGGLAGFAIAAYASARTGTALIDALSYGLAGGVAGALVAWTAAVTAWRALMVAEMREVRARAIVRAQERAAELEAERAAARERATRRRGEALDEPIQPIQPFERDVDPASAVLRVGAPPKHDRDAPPRRRPPRRRPPAAPEPEGPGHIDTTA